MLTPTGTTRLPLQTSKNRPTNYHQLIEAARRPDFPEPDQALSGLVTRASRR
jgi:hypothetical protein